MANHKDTMESTCKVNQQQDNLEELKKSPLFYLSAGSKELFHSDFLYWIAKQHWEVFIRVMRTLAGHKDDKPFWWEGDYTLEEKNLEVRRESKHFDLAIYVRPKKDKKEWVPVLVFENKVKSLPYAKQLKDYSVKAEKEWNDKKENREKNQNITYILLSLTNADSLQTDPTLNRSWIFTKYNKLVNALENNLSKCTDYYLQLCKDYCCFIRALLGLAKRWKIINTGDGYLARLCPQAIKDKDKNLLDTKNKKLFAKTYKEYTDLSELRLNDLWQKVSFDNLRILLEEMLEKQLPKNKNKINPYLRDQKTSLEPGFYLATGYTRDTGLIELRYVLEDYPENKEPISVMVQIQGSQYRYAVTANTKVCKIKNRKVYPIGKAKEHNFNEWLSEHPNMNNSWCHYGEYFIYQYRKIKPSETIENIIHCIVDDAKGILINFRR